MPRVIDRESLKKYKVAPVRSVFLISFKDEVETGKGKTFPDDVQSSA